MSMYSIKPLPYCKEISLQLIKNRGKKRKVFEQVCLPQCLRWWWIHLQCWRPRSDPWVGKIPCRRAWQPTPAWRIPRDRGAWWATVHGVTMSRAQRSEQAQHSGSESAQRLKTGPWVAQAPPGSRTGVRGLHRALSWALGARLSETLTVCVILFLLLTLPNIVLRSRGKKKCDSSLGQNYRVERNSCRS